jgi:hypothetical protein
MGRDLCQKMIVGFWWVLIGGRIRAGVQSTPYIDDIIYEQALIRVWSKQSVYPSGATKVSTLFSFLFLFFLSFFFSHCYFLLEGVILW